MIALRIIILTFVAWPLNLRAAPDELRPQLESLEDTKKGNTKPDFESENLILSHPFRSLDKQMFNRDYYPYKQSISLRSGLSVSQEKQRAFRLGVNYLYHRSLLPQWELGLDVASGSIGYLMVNLRWTLNRRTSFRPFLKAGMSHRVVGNEQIASFTNKKNYFIFGALGFEKGWTENISFRSDLELSVGLEEIWVAVIFGASKGW